MIIIKSKDTKYYCRQISPEIQESPFSSFDANEIWNEITITGNENFVSHYSKEYLDLKDKIDDFLSPDAPEIDNAAMSYLCKHFPKADNSNYTEDEKKKWIDLYKKYTPDFRNELRIIADILTMMYPGSKYVTRVIYGDCQSDWNYVVYDSNKYSDDDIKALTTEYFNTGSEWIIHDDPNLDIIENPEDINGYSMYCHDSDSETALKEIAEYLETDVKNITAYAFDGYIRTPKYKLVT